MDQPQLYSHSNSQQRTDAKYVLDNYLQLIRWNIAEQPETILDIGCGDGGVLFDILLPKLPQNFHKLYGIDISEKFLDYASKRNNDKRIVFEKFDITSNELPRKYYEQFNHIFSFYCLHWAINQKQAFENIYNMLRSDGDMLLTFLVKHPFFDVYKILSKTNQWSKYKYDVDQFIGPYQYSIDPEIEMENLLRQQGFTGLLCQTISHSFSFPNITSVIDTMCSVNPFIARLPKNLIEDYIEDFIDELKKMENVTIQINIHENDGKIQMQYKLFVIVATKS